MKMRYCLTVRLMVILVTTSQVFGCADALKRTETQQIGDNKLTCAELKKEIDSLGEKKDESTGKAVLGLGAGTVGAIALAPLALIAAPVAGVAVAAGALGAGVYGAKKGVDASDEQSRRQHLINLYNEKCSPTKSNKKSKQ